MFPCPTGYRTFDGESEALENFTRVISFGAFAETNKYKLLFKRVGSRRLHFLLYAYFEGADNPQNNNMFLCSFTIYFDRSAIRTTARVRDISINPSIVYLFLHTEGESLGTINPMVGRLLPAVVHSAISSFMTNSPFVRVFRLSQARLDNVANQASAAVYDVMYNAIPQTRSREIAERNESEVYGNVYNRRRGAGFDIAILVVVSAITAGATAIAYKAYVSQ